LPFALVPIPRKDYERQLERLNLATAESDAWLAEYHLRFKRTAEAKVLIDAALAENPDLALGHEAMGTYDILLGDYRNALKEFSAATAADPSLYLSFYSKGVLFSYWKARPTFQKAVSAIYAARQNLLPDTRPPLWLSPGCW
jgi:tetratricopeptide (TPR) repeat protein